MSDVEQFIIAACVPRDASHSDGGVEDANRILAAHAEVATANIHTAAILGDAGTVRRCIAADPASATARWGPHHWDALTHLAFSRYLKLEPHRTPGFIEAATALLDAGADANSGWYEHEHEPRGTWESVLYGAAGVSHNPELTRLLLSRGADPNDDETCYHTPESDDNRALAALVETGRITAANLSMMLVRKHDWHDIDGERYLLEHGASANPPPGSGWSALHHALKRANSLDMIELLLDHGADPAIETEGIAAFSRAAREGRSDVLAAFEQHGHRFAPLGVDRLIVACARDDAAAIATIAATEPALVAELIAMGGTLVAKFTSNWNTAGVRRLLDLGVAADAPFTEGDGYFGIAERSMPIHVAAWRAQPAIVQLLIERGSPVDAPDARGRTPLALAVIACVDSYWMERRTPESVRVLLEAGASPRGIPYPCGYDEVDALLQARQR